MLTIRAANLRVSVGIYSFGAMLASRLRPSGVISKAQAMTRATGKPSRKQHHKPDGPIWNFEEWKNLGGDLNQEPGDNSVSDCDPVDVAPLQLSRKVARIHFLPSQVKAILFEVGVGRNSGAGVLVSCHDFPEFLCIDALGSFRPN